jgi:hypothetical protein
VTQFFLSVTNLWTLYHALSRFPKSYLAYRDKEFQSASHRFKEFFSFKTLQNASNAEKHFETPCHASPKRI